MNKTLKGVLLGLAIAAVLTVGVLAALGIIGGQSIERNVQFTINVNPSGAFELAIVPTDVTVTRGDPLSFVLTATPSDGFDAAIALTVGGLPAGSWTLDQSVLPGPADYTATLTVNTTMLQSNHSYVCSITGVDQ